MSVKNLEDAFVEELRDVLHAEKQITKALKQMIKKATSEKLKEAFELHLEETEGQIERIESAFESIDVKPRAKTCEAMSGIIEEGKEVMEEADEDEVRDAMMIAAAQKVEHYEIASYGTLCTWANTLGFKQAEKLLQENLKEEKATDEKLNKLASQLNKEALPA